MVEYPLFQLEDGGSNPTSALQLNFHKIQFNAAKNIYEKFHYLGATPFLSSIDFGAYFNNYLVGAISYGCPNAPNLKGYFDKDNQYGWFEIKRLALSDICPRNSESRFIGWSIKELKKYYNVKGVITYADTSQGHKGTIYKASGFKSLGLTAVKKDYFVNGKQITRGKIKDLKGYWLDRPQKKLFIKTFLHGIKRSLPQSRNSASG